MIHYKNISLFVLLMFTFIGCTEIYTPKIDSSASALVVKGLITDGAGPFTINLSKATLFTSDSIYITNYVLGAKLTVNDNENHAFPLTDAGNGNYILPTAFKAIIGYSYKLNIVTTDGNIYESNPEILQSPLTYDSIRGFYSNESYLNPDNNPVTVNGADIRVDLFKSVSNSDSIPLCRFTSEITTQYYFTYFVPDSTSWHWYYFGWQNYALDKNENITDDNSLTTSHFIKNHPLCFFPFEMVSYSFVPPVSVSPIVARYYLRFNQYTIDRDSYNFYKGANNQLAASGKIFDPVTAQLYGNMKCLNNPSKIVLGLFEVSSVTQSACVVNYEFPVYPNNTYSISVQKVSYIDNIPSSGVYRYKVWTDFGSPQPKDSAFNVIPYPIWWTH